MKTVKRPNPETAWRQAARHALLVGGAEPETFGLEFKPGKNYTDLNVLVVETMCRDCPTAESEVVILTANLHKVLRPMRT